MDYIRYSLLVLQNIEMLKEEDKYRKRKQSSTGKAESVREDCWIHSSELPLVLILVQFGDVWRWQISLRVRKLMMIRCLQCY